MKLKQVTIEGKNYAELDGEKPIYVHPDGKEASFDVPDMYARLTRDGKRNSELQKTLEATEGKLLVFDGIVPEDARKAIDLVKNLDHKKLVDAGEVEKVKAEAIKAVTDSFESKYSPIVKERDRLKSDLFAEKIGGAFTRSKLITEKFAIPADLVQARFGGNFKIEDGKVTATDASGNRIYSRARPGELADFDEALETLVDQYPYRDQILKGSGSSGSGAQPGATGNGAKRTISRAEFAKLEPMAQRAAATGKDAMTITE